MMEVKKQYNNAMKRLSLVHNYQYVDRPYSKTNPVSYGPVMSLIIYGFLGLMLGVLFSIMLHFFRSFIMAGGPGTGA